MGLKIKILLSLVDIVSKFLRLDVSENWMSIALFWEEVYRVKKIPKCLKMGKSFGSMFFTP